MDSEIEFLEYDWNFNEQIVEKKVIFQGEN